ncbi:MAG TPA: Ppx/GppA phosphatase family protein [Acidimicrobiia bacterium]|jgi:exopolyphosphatase/guanosine-5'-triphosphate,3'-diphosphate pyrophosphatase|nr:Ppx/GppA phosphatase family protein [Acidimicrobiia bacterium]
MKRLAAIDMGTNSTRLLVADGEDGGTTGPLKTVERHMHITRLGQGVNATRRLHPDAIQRTLEVLRKYRDVMDSSGVEGVRATATSAARDAVNRDELLSPAAEILGTTVELLSGQDEGRLTFLGATTGLDAPAPHLVVDIGGGSTEFIVGTGGPAGAGGGPEVAGVMSIDVGCVRLTEAWLHSDPPAPEELSQALSVVQAYLDDVDRDLPAVGQARTLIGTAGTVTTVAAVEIGLAEYDPEVLHHFRLTREAAEDVFRTLATERAAERRHNPGLEPARVDVIVGGAAVLVAVMRRWDFDEMIVSEADILDGLVRSQL